MNDQPASPAPIPASKMSDLKTRVMSGVVMIVAAIAALLIGGEIFALFWLGAAAAVLWEWLHLTGVPRPRAIFAVGAALLAVAASIGAHGFAHFAVLPLIAAALAIGFYTDSKIRRNLHAVAEDGMPVPLPFSRPVVWAAMGAFYAGLFLVAVMSLRTSLLYGMQAVLWLFAVVWGTDILAYFGGRFIGGPKLWPRVSPSKTWSGFTCGVIGGSAAGVLAMYFALPPARQSLGVLFVIGLMAAAISQAGDLFESSLKRRAGVKDSSKMIPGHGGMMDRLDGFIFASIFAGLLGLLRGGPLNAAGGLLLW
jgi:phosphatidate cytidylyltransferase